MAKPKLPREIRICLYVECKRLYECKVVDTRQFCSRPCFYKHRREDREIRVCILLECEVSFECRVSDGQKYCTTQCSSVDRRGIPRTQEVKDKIGVANTKDNREIRVCVDEDCFVSFEVRPFEGKKYCSSKCVHKNIATVERNKKIGDALRGRPKSKEHKLALKKVRSTPEYIAKQLKSRFVRPTKPEKEIDKLLQELFPNEWKYVGDGEFILARKCPDFVNVNGQKKIIEMFGDYWHGEGKTGVPNEQHAQERIDCFTPYGYQTLIIWEYELLNITEVINKIQEFCNGKT